MTSRTIVVKNDRSPEVTRRSAGGQYASVMMWKHEKYRVSSSVFSLRRGLFLFDMSGWPRVFARHSLNEQGLESSTALMSIEKLGIRDDMFDVVVSTGVLHQARSVEQYSEALSEVSRVMRNGGVFSMNVFTNSAWDETYIIPDKDEPFTVLTQEGLWMTPLPKEMLYNLAASNGLELEEEVAEDLRQENTGPRAVLRTHFIKR